MRGTVLETIVPFEHRWLSAKEVALLLGYAQRYVTNTLQHAPGFPKAERSGRPRWLAREVMDWQFANRALQQDRRRKRSSKSEGCADRGAQSRAPAPERQAS